MSHAVKADQPSESAASAPSSGQDARAYVVSVLEAEAEAVCSIARTIDGESIDRAVDLINGCRGHIVVSGMGKSGFIAQKISATLSSIGIPSHFVHPAEAVHGDLGRIRREDVLWAMSFSGNTEEVVTLASLLRADSIPVIGMSSDGASRLAKASDVHLALGEITEACPHNLAPTASTTAMLALGDAIGLAASRLRNFTANDYRKRHPGGMLGLSLRPVTEVLRFRVPETLPLIPESETVRGALKRADIGRRPGALLIVDEKDGRLAGIFTDGDLRRLVMKDAGVLDRPICEVMTRAPSALRDDQLVRDTVDLVRETRRDEIPVIDALGRPVGLLDVQDLIALRIIRDP